MSSYCTIQDVSNHLPDSVVIGTNLLQNDVNVLESQVEEWIQQTASVIDGYISSVYRVPLIKWKEPDFSVNPVTFTEKYPNPIVLINIRLTAAQVYDYIMSAEQSPNVSDYAKNQRALAFDDLQKVITGQVQLQNQVRMGLRFVRQELLDPSRSPIPDTQDHNRSAGE